MSDLLDAALQYAGRGWRVFPCRPRGKKPLTKTGFKAATVAPSQIEAWWAQWPDANVAIATGRASGLIVLDVDGAQGLTTLQDIVNRLGVLPPTSSVVTARGFHLYYHWPPGGAYETIRCSAGDGLDVRADGGYVIAPPSIHESGHVYLWRAP